MMTNELFRIDVIGEGGSGGGETYRIKGGKIRCSMISASVCILQEFD